MKHFKFARYGHSSPVGEKYQFVIEVEDGDIHEDAHGKFMRGKVISKNSNCHLEIGHEDWFIFDSFDELDSL